ncbi:MAG: ABC transporter permease subunit, partial [Anaerolineae bacterium]|nr:ABC transporter permease subunit [Anaerolineae bacterium]
AIPPPVWALILLFVLFPGIVPAALALGLYTLGILGRLTAEVIEELDERPLRALAAQGAPGPGILLYGVLPATLPRFVAYALYRWEVCARETAVIGVVGVGGLGRLLAEQFSGFDYRGVVTTLLFFMALTLIVDLVSTAARRALR